MIARIRDTDGRLIVIAGAIAGVRAACDLAESRGAKVVSVDFGNDQNNDRNNENDADECDESPLDGEAENTPARSGNDLCATQGR